MDKHTPTPWISKHPSYYSEDSEQILCKVDDEDNGIVVASYVRKANAAFIVRACNSFEENEKKIQILQRFVEKATGWTCDEIAQYIAKSKDHHGI